MKQKLILPIAMIFSVILISGVLAEPTLDELQQQINDLQAQLDI